MSWQIPSRLVLDAVLLLAAVQLVVARAGSGRWMHPACVWSGIWFLQFLGIRIWAARFVPVSDLALGICAVGMSIFNLGAALGGLIVSYHDKPPGCTKSSSIRPARSFKLASTVCLVVAFVLTGLMIYQFFSKWNGDFGTTLKDVRIAIGEGLRPYGHSEYAITFAMATFCASMCFSGANRAHRFPRLAMVLSGVLSVICGVLSSGRGEALKPLLVGAIAFSLFHARSRWWVVILPVAIVIAASTAFVGIGMALEKVDAESSTWLDSIVEYQWSPLPALSTWLQTNWQMLIDSPPSEFSRSLRFFDAVKYRLGYGDLPVQLPMEFVDVPSRTNIYTIFKFWIEEYGLFGLLLAPLLVGSFHAFVFHIGTSSSATPLTRYFLVTSYLPLIVVAGGETYVQQLSTWLQLALLGLWLLGPSLARSGRRPDGIRRGVDRGARWE